MTKSVAQLEKMMVKSILIVMFNNEDDKKVIQQLNLYQISERGQILTAVKSARNIKLKRLNP